ncbi:MAG TPA: patatin-like phospholipase family protein [Flavobacteriaceae bacterium]|nr:patatin-like phospholipase family protein [Flavobacteriaceae bacterium]
MGNLFLKGPEVTELVIEARKIKDSGKVFSDIVDDKGNQYVDFVQQGGGMLGIGLTGYTYILEQAGIRFYSLAGTSAGALNSLLMASMKKIGEPVSVKILTILSKKNLFDFVDGPSGIKNLIQRQIEGKKGLVWSLIWNSLSIYFSLKNNFGLNPGKELYNWIEEQLQNNEIHTYADLKNLRQRPDNLYHRLGDTKEISRPKISFITSEITTHSRIELPKMADLYWEDPNTASPAEFVHASLAVPYFFYPFEKTDIPRAGERDEKKWMKYASFSGKIPNKVKFVDGGLLSNFPIDVFHINGVPSRPTFGARLSAFRDEYAPTNTVFKYSGAIISTMRQIHDYEVILRNPDYKQLICNIDADKEFNWLNFNMSAEKQQQLFILGARKALAFLKKFNWEHYKETRRNGLK